MSFSTSHTPKYKVSDIDSNLVKNPKSFLNHFESFGLFTIVVLLVVREGSQSSPAEAEVVLCVCPRFQLELMCTGRDSFV